MSASGWKIQNVAESLHIGPFKDISDYSDIEDLADTMTVLLSKNDGALVARDSANAISYDSNGFYFVPVNANDKDTLGTLKVVVNGASHFPIWETYRIVTQAQYDYFGTLNVTPMLTLLGTGQIASGHITNYQYVEDRVYSFTAKDINGDEINLTGKTLKMVCETKDTAESQWELDDSYVTPSGSTVNIVMPAKCTTSPGSFNYNVRNVTDGNDVVGYGEYTCIKASKEHV